MDPSDPQGDLLQPKPPAESTAIGWELQQQIQDMRSLFTATFVALILLGLGLGLFMGKQWSMVQRQLNETKQQVARVSTQFHQEREPRMKSFLAQLQTFAAQNRDFQPILDRYRIVLPQYLGAPVPAVGQLAPSPGARPAIPPAKK